MKTKSEAIQGTSLNLELLRYARNDAKQVKCFLHNHLLNLSIVAVHMAEHVNAGATIDALAAQDASIHIDD